MWPFEPYKIDTEFRGQASYGIHEGLDLNLKGTSGNQDCGTPIKCIYSGEVVHFSRSKFDYGDMIVVESNTPEGKRWTRYCHLDQRLITSGLVKRGDILGTMGSTGNSTACHLHLDCLKRKPANWRFYTQINFDMWFVDPRELINAIISPEMPEWLSTVLRDDLKIDTSAQEGDVRGRIGEIKNKLSNYDSLQKQITGLEKEVAKFAGEAAQFEEELRISLKARERLEGEVEGLIKEKIAFENRISDLEEEVKTLKETIDPESVVLVPKDEYERLVQKKVLDRFSTLEITKELFKRIIGR